VELQGWYEKSKEKYLISTSIYIRAVYLNIPYCQSPHFSSLLLTMKVELLCALRFYQSRLSTVN
jgi:hypothetical protein